MDRNRFNDWIQIVGIIAVVVSLVFVGMEVRQNSIATRAATNSAIKDSFRELNLAIATDYQLALALIRAGDNPSEAAPEDQYRILALWRALFHIWSNVHRQHINDTVDASLFDAVVQEIETYAGVAGNPRATESASTGNRYSRASKQMRWAWESERFIYNPEFQQFVDERLGIDR